MNITPQKTDLILPITLITLPDNPELTSLMNIHIHSYDAVCVGMPRLETVGC